MKEDEENHKDEGERTRWRYKDFPNLKMREVNIIVYGQHAIACYNMIFEGKITEFLSFKVFLIFFCRLY